MLIALLDRRPKALALHTTAARARHRPIVIGPVVAQVWRDSRRTTHELGTLLQECTVIQARGAQPAMRDIPASAATVQCIPCAAGFTLHDYKRVGQILGKATLPAKKRPDVVDAMVVTIGALHHRAVICTSDPEDLGAYAATLKAAELTISRF
ncbi:hypothetical protein [Streptomyces litchfieldiae]|uniref:PIN domain-containing protein n=1 Tax=Streptomyces litchfieldiae TaxID=3075543 RepID=A0ABU2MX45_9ACTN|nr:hypothetical protein [Streptomyces sp. DSM 44938]MDT0346220.1 hypothetical protein [Streptomyces sp. DSM 44938]